jgi:radical SAM protein with 4Fe4S-binding SPASM domain
MQRSKLGPLCVAKNVWRVLRHPGLAARFLTLAGEKHFSLLLNPRARRGYAGKICTVVVKPTDLCNLRCRVCGQWGDHGYQLSRNIECFRENEVPLSRYVSLLEDLCAHGHRPLIVLLGGEPMLYEGTLELIEIASRLGLPVTMTTNGTGVPAAAGRLANAPLFGLQLSIDGHTAELHNFQRPGARSLNNFSQIDAALTAAAEAREASGSGLPLITAITVITRYNAGHLLDIYEALRQRVDLFVFSLSWWIDEAAAQAHEADFFRRFGFVPQTHRGYLSDLKPRDYHTLHRQLEEILSRSRPWNATPVCIIPPFTSVADLTTYYTNHQAHLGYNRCKALFQEIEVMSDGRVTPCRTFVDYTVGNVKDATLTELWNSPAYVSFRRSLRQDGLMPVCSRCCGLMGFS